MPPIASYFKVSLSDYVLLYKKSRLIVIYETAFGVLMIKNVLTKQQ